MSSNASCDPLVEHILPRHTHVVGVKFSSSPMDIVARELGMPKSSCFAHVTRYVGLIFVYSTWI